MKRYSLIVALHIIGIAFPGESWQTTLSTTFER